mgnify:CR=1 FL=1
MERRRGARAARSLRAGNAGAPNLPADEAARQALRVDPRAIGVWGMAIAVLSGLASALASLDPFTGLWLILADLALSTVLVFDIGVYLAVFGAILTLVFALEETL